MIRSLFYSILNAIIPPRETGRVVDALHIEDLFMIKKGDALPYHEKAVTALVWELKYNKNRKALALAGEFLSEELLAIASEELGKPLLIPIPMHPSRKRERGYNQTELLCEAARKHVGNTFEYAPYTLRRIKNTLPQQSLPRHTRLHNLKNSMEVWNVSKIKGRTCVVVDDVSTTGATLEEAKRALKAAGAARVYTLALARS